MFLITRCKNGDRRLFHLKTKQMSYKGKCLSSAGSLRQQRRNKNQKLLGLWEIPRMHKTRWRNEYWFVAWRRIIVLEIMTVRRSQVMEEEKHIHGPLLQNDHLFEILATRHCWWGKIAKLFSLCIERVSLSNCHSARGNSCCLTKSNVALHNEIVSSKYLQGGSWLDFCCLLMIPTSSAAVVTFKIGPRPGSNKISSMGHTNTWKLSNKLPPKYFH